MAGTTCTSCCCAFSARTASTSTQASTVWRWVRWAFRSLLIVVAGDRVFAAVHQHSGHSDGRRRGLRPEPHLLGDDHHSLPGVLARSLRVQLLPCRGLRRRHLHVLRRCHVRSRNGERVCLREGGHLRSLQQVAPPLLHPSTGELLAFASELFGLIPCPRHRLPK